MEGVGVHAGHIGPNQNLDKPRKMGKGTRLGKSGGLCDLTDLTEMKMRISILVILTAIGLASSDSRGQQANPVYVDDSPAALDTFVRAGELVASGNETEAVRALQKLLDEEPDRLAPMASDSSLYLSVRQRVHALLLSDPALLEKYRAIEGPRADELVASGEHVFVERTRQLTFAGFEATLRTAQVHLEAAQFEAARLTLEQLDNHPDMASAENQDGAQAAVELLGMVARYLDRSSVWEQAERWAKEAGMAAPLRQAVTRPVQAGLRSTDALSPIAGASPQTVPTRPLWSVMTEPLGAAVPIDARAVAQGRVPSETPLWILPAAMDEVVYVNDGQRVSAWDRLTLTLKWRVSPLPPPTGLRDQEFIERRGNFGRQFRSTLEDASSISGTGRIILATTGFTYNGSRAGDPRLHAFDAQTGRVLWSVDPSLLDPVLNMGSIRGAVMIADDVAIVAVRKAVRGRRLVSLYLVAFDIATGTKQWMRLVGSAGSLPFLQDRRAADSGIVHEGVVYQTDRIGVVGAFEAAGGRPIWVRTIPIRAMSSQERSSAWETSRPVVYGSELIILSSDRRSLIRLNRKTGQLIRSQSASEFGAPKYLLRVGEYLCAIGDDRVGSIRFAELDDGTVQMSESVGQEGIRGRSVVAQDLLLLPTVKGFVRLDPARGRAEVISLERPGNMLPLGDQLLVVDHEQLHSYLAWDVASALLTKRMEADPLDPRPAVTYTDLAYRANRPEQIPAAADRALASIGQDPGSKQGRASRQYLFETLREVVETSQASWTDAAGVGGAQKKAGQGGLEPVKDLGLLAQILERLGRTAETHGEQVLHLMALSRQREAEGNPSGSVDAVQRVLADPALAGAVWAGPTIVRRAELEASRRLRRLVAKYGGEIYRTYDEDARRQAQGLGEWTNLDRIEELARRYPIASAAPDLWLKAAELHERAGRSHEHIGALTDGMEAAEIGLAVGLPVNSATHGELAGWLVTAFREQDQLAAAAQNLRHIRETFPELVLTSRGSLIEIEKLEKELMSRLAASARLPRIGSQAIDEAQTIDGWKLLSPMSQERAWSAAGHVVLFSTADQRIGLWGRGSVEEPAADRANGVAGLALQWSRRFGDIRPELLRLDADAAYFAWYEEDGISIERIDTIGGASRWKTKPIESLLPARADMNNRIDVGANRGPLIELPLDPPQRPTDLVMAMDEQVLIIAERSGRLLALDLSIGQVIWTDRGAVDPVHDLDVNAGLVVVTGALSKLPEGARRGSSWSAVAAYDARSGEKMEGVASLPGSSRWIRAINASTAIVGLGTEIVLIDVLRGRTNWSITDEPAHETVDAWVMDDRLFIMNRGGRVWLAGVTTGRVNDVPLDLDDRTRSSRPVRAVRSGKDVAFLSSRGVAIVDPVGKIVGKDALDSPDRLLMPGVSELYYVLLGTDAAALADGRPVYNMYFATTTTGKLVGGTRLVLYSPPEQMAVLDGLVVVSAGEVTVVIAVPAEDP